MILSQLGIFWVIALFVAGLVLLFGGGHFLVDGSAKIARLLGIHPIIVGLTIVALGTSMPELLVSLTAALKGQSDVALGNIIGSNVSNIGLILGLSALARPLNVHPNLLKSEIPIVIAVSIVFWLLCLNGTLGRIDGMVLVIGFVIYLSLVIRGARRDAKNYQRTDEQNNTFRSTVMKNSILVLIGIAALKFGADWVVDSATEISRRFGVSELILGLTIVAIGTSLPELATSVVAALKKEGDISVGNIIGSNIFNMMFIAGPTAIIRPLTVQSTLNSNHLPIMVGITLLMLPLLRSNRELSRPEGAVLLASYIAIMLFWTL